MWLNIEFLFSKLRIQQFDNDPSSFMLFHLHKIYQAIKPKNEARDSHKNNSLKIGVYYIIYFLGDCPSFFLLVNILAPVDILTVYPPFKKNQIP